MSVDKWEQRMLCPDGACVGVISMNGTCKVCGTAVPNWGDPRKPGRVSSKAEADELEHEPEHEEDEDDADEETATNGEAKTVDAEANDDDITKRKLCADGACVGVIGANGKCKVCGKTADGSRSDDDDDEDDDDEYEDDEDVEGVEGDTAASVTTGATEADGANKADAKKADHAKPADDDNRALCSDGACVGVIGDDGKCKICGKTAA